MNALVPLIDPVAVAQFGLRLHVAGIAAGIGFGEPKTPQPLAAARAERGTLLLLFGSEEIEWRRAERDVRGHRNRGGRVGTRDLHHSERVADRVGARAAVFFGKRQAHEPELGHFRNQLVRERAHRDPSLRRAASPLRAQTRGQALDRLLLVGQVEVHGGGIGRRLRKTPLFSDDLPARRFACLSQRRARPG